MQEAEGKCKQSLHAAEDSCIAEAIQYMWAHSDQITQKPVDAIGRIVSVSSSGFIGEKNGRKVPYDKYGNRK